jgi:hypothetical protein
MGLIDRILSKENLRLAYQQVVSNKGSAGVDGIGTEALKPYLGEHWARLKEELQAGRYQPGAVLGVKIPKRHGGERLLGIPTTNYEYLGFAFESSYQKGVQGQYQLVVSKTSWQELKYKIRQITRKTIPASFDERIERLSLLMRGWINYFKPASIHGNGATVAWGVGLFRAALSWARPLPLTA